MDVINQKWKLNLNCACEHVIARCIHFVIRKFYHSLVTLFVLRSRVDTHDFNKPGLTSSESTAKRNL